MKKWVVYLLGILTGVVLTIAALVVISLITNAIDKKSETTTTPEVTKVEEKKSDDNITMFDQPGEVLEEKAFEVFQVLAEDAALVSGQTPEARRAGLNIYTGTTCLITNREGQLYYDDQKIKATAGKVFRQVGIFRYEAKNGDFKTIPIIMLMDK